MSITLELPGDLLKELRELTAKLDDGAAIEEAVSEFIRLKRLQELKSAPSSWEATQQACSFRRIPMRISWRTGPIMTT
jgi:hypothetical protein